MGIHTQAARGGAFRARYLRRVLGLILLGAIHAAFFFFGDILVAYALLGLFMLRPVRREWPVRKLVRSAVILLAIQAAIVLALVALTRAAPGEDASFAEYVRQGAELYRTGSFWAVVPHRLTDFAIVLSATIVIQGWGLLAMFRLGFAAAKMFAQGGAEAARPLARRILWLALIPSLAANAVCAVLAVTSPEPWASSAALLQLAFFAPILSLAYLAAATLILTSPAGKRLVRVLGAAGRMSLSVYVGQSVIMSLLFHGYGLGLASSIGSAAGVLVCIAVYAALVGFSHLWFGAFRIGPLEWILRSITEWQWVALRPRRETPTDAAAA